MSNNLNQKFPPYVESDLNKAKLVKPPRIKAKEVDVYIYETNKTILDVIQNDSALSIQAKFSKSIKFQSTVPLNGDIAKPKFADPSDSAIWGGQINGIIFEELNLNSSNYNFFTFGLFTQDQIASAIKYRITSYEPVYDNKNKFLYATLIAIQDSIKTIKSIQKLNWNLVQSFQADVKTKYLKLEFDYKMGFFSGGLKISGLPEQQLRPVDVGYNINLINEELVAKFIKVRQTNPLEIDDLTLSDLNERTVSDGSTSNSGYAVVRKDQANLEDPRITITPDLITLSAAEVNLSGSAQTPPSNIVSQLDYFSSGLNINTRTVSSNPQNNVNVKTKLIELKENNLSGAIMKQFLNGTFAFNGELIEKSDPFTITNALQKITDLNKTNATDKLYFVLCKKSNLSRYLDFRIARDGQGAASGAIIAKNPFPKTRLLNSSEWGTNFIDQNNIVVDMELQAPVFNIKLDYELMMGEFIKITQYDENHQIIGTPELRFQTENVFNDAKKKGSIQL